MNNKVICILGPTASGKTNLAFELAKHLPIEIVSVDSALIYRDMNIGTAKPRPEELACVPHHLIDICDPTENYSVGQFCTDAIEIIDDILQRGKTPVLVGGTMMYFYLLQKGFSQFPDSDFSMREQIAQKAAEFGWDKLHEELEKIDPLAAAQIHKHDTQRISRALELYYATGQTRSELQEGQNWQQHPYEFINIILAPKNRQILHQRIEKRVDEMLIAGLIDEVKALHQRGDLSLEIPSIRSVGYRQVWQYLNGELDEKDLRFKIIVATRQLAKRQFTWLKRFPGQRFDSEADDLSRLVLAHLNLQAGSGL